MKVKSTVPGGEELSPGVCKTLALAPCLLKVGVCVCVWDGVLSRLLC